MALTFDVDDAPAVETAPQPPIAEYVAGFYANQELVQSAGPETVTGIEDAPTTRLNDPDVEERSVCGAFWFFPEEMIQAWKIRVQGIDKPGEKIFTREKHRHFILKAIEINRKGLQVDPITMVKNTKPADVNRMGGMQYCMNHANYFFSIKSSTSHLDMLIDNYRRRALDTMTTEVIEQVKAGGDVNQGIADLTNGAKGLLRGNSTMQSMDPDSMVDTLEQIIGTAEADTSYIPCSFRNLARVMGDHPRGEIRAIGAPSGNGKTALVLTEILFALEHGFVADIFLLESSRQQLVERTAMQKFFADGRNFRSRKTTPSDREALHNAAEYLTKFNGRLHMAPRGLFSAMDIRAMIQERKQRTGQPCDLIVVDHLQRLKACNSKHSPTDFAAVHENVEQLWALAAEENAALLLLCQLSLDEIRHSFKKDNKFPTMGAFKGGAIHEAAKSALILYMTEEESHSGKPVMHENICIVKANDSGKGRVQALLIGPHALHVEDTCQHDRLQYQRQLAALGFPLERRRKDDRRIDD